MVDFVADYSLVLATHWQQSPIQQLVTVDTVANTVDFVADIVNSVASVYGCCRYSQLRRQCVRGKVDFPQSRSCWIRLCRHCVPGLSKPVNMAQNQPVWRLLATSAHLWCKPEMMLMKIKHVLKSLFIFSKRRTQTCVLLLQLWKINL